MPDGTIPDLVTRSDALLLRAVRSDLREVDFVASTDAVDSYDEVIDQTSWQLDRFKANPVILYGHQSYELPIGQATRCEVNNGALEVTIRFATEDANPVAERVWQLVQQKVLRAVSVGFRPHDGRYELRDGNEVFVLRNCELREVSVVAIPANPECLAKMKSAARAATKSTTELVRAVDGINEITPSASRFTNNNPSPNGGQETTMNQLASIIAVLGLASASTELDVIERIRGLDGKAKSADALTAEKTTLESKVRALESDNATLKSEKDVLAKEHEKACSDRDVATKRADEAEGKLIELEVDALVGKKITPAEKADFVAMRKKMPDTFKSIVEKRPDMKLTHQVIKGSGTDSPGDASDLLAELNGR